MEKGIKLIIKKKKRRNAENRPIRILYKRLKKGGRNCK